MRNYKRLYIYLSLSFVFAIFFCVVSCEDGTITEDEYQISYNRTAQLTNLYQNGVLPLHQLFIDEITILSANAKTFSETTSTENLIVLQNQWKKTVSIWKQCELFDIGDINDSFIHYRINRWPTDVDNIEEYVLSLDPINKEFVSSKGSSSKGISAVEYLLFNLDNTPLLSEFENNPRRVNYLVATLEVLQDDATELYNLWVTYSDVFVNSLENGVDGGQNQLINAIVGLLEEITQSKLGKALGESNGGTPDIEEFEAHRSDWSLEMIKSNLISLEKSYDGSYTEDSRKFGFDNYLIELDNKQLSDAISAQFKVCFASVDKITSLNNTVVNNPTLVENLKNDLTNLLVLIKVDMSNFIGSTITFNDNDGD